MNEEREKAKKFVVRRPKTTRKGPDGSGNRREAGRVTGRHSTRRASSRFTAKMRCSSALLFPSENVLGTCKFYGATFLAHSRKRIVVFIQFRVRTTENATSGVKLTLAPSRDWTYFLTARVQVKEPPGA